MLGLFVMSGSINYSSSILPQKCRVDRIPEGLPSGHDGDMDIKIPLTYFDH